ncbi:MAG: helix-turn-helix transcriptional regulator [Acidobacteriota bacterium]|nr:helix-turn-helix transcriptional regulator [Acidobacteriota bacterium]
MPRATQPLLRKVGDRVRTIRLARGISQEALAHAAGLDRSYMSGIERGVRNVTLLKLQAVARALKLPIRELLPDD